MPLSVDIISDFFEDRERDFLIGFGTSTIACIGAIFFQLGGGILADSFGWQYGFLTYLFPIWILALTFLFLPEPEKRKIAENQLKQKVKTPRVIYGVSFGQIIFSALVYGYVTNISVVIQAENLGTATQAGMAISVFTFGTLLAGFVFGRIKHLFSDSYIPLAIFLTGLGMLICFFSHSLTMIFVGSIVGGAGMGIGIPGVFARVTEATPKNSTTSYVGLVVAAQGVGGIIGPFAFSLILDVLSKDIGRFPLAISAVGLFALAIVWFVLVKVAKPVNNPESDIEVTT